MPALLQHCNINHKIGRRDMLNSYKIFNFHDLCQKLHENHRPYTHLCLIRFMMKMQYWRYFNKSKKTKNNYFLFRLLI